MAAEVAIPEAPNPAPEKMESGTPTVVLDGERYAIGWQHFPAAAGGPAYVTVRRGVLGGRRVLGRYPLTPDGWAQAWGAFVRLDPATARLTSQALGSYYAVRPPAGLLAFVPGLMLSAIERSADRFVLGMAYDLRFGDHSIQIVPARSPEAAAEYRYGEVSAIQVTGFEHASTQSKWELFALYYGAPADTREYRIHLRIQTFDRSLHFWHAAKSAADIGRWLQPLNRGIQQAALAGAEDRAQRQSEWLVAELSRLANLLEHGTLTVSDISLLQGRLSGGF